MSTNVKYNNIRVLSLVPTSQGTGYAVVECPPILVIDRGVFSLKRDRGEHIRNLSKFIAWYRPDVLLVEDMLSEQFRRRARTRVTIETVIGLAGGYGISVRPVAREEVLAHFDVSDATPKAVIARLTS